MTEILMDVLVWRVTSGQDVLQDCILVFELPLQLSNSDKTLLAGVAFSSDKKEQMGNGYSVILADWKVLY